VRSHNPLQTAGLVQDSLQLGIVVDHIRRPRMCVQRLFQVCDSAAQTCFWKRVEQEDYKGAVR